MASITPAQTVESSLSNHGLSLSEVSGVETNRDLAKVNAAIEQSVKKNFDLIALEKRGNKIEVQCGSFKQAFFAAIKPEEQAKIAQILEADPRLSRNGAIVMPPKGEVAIEKIENLALEYAKREGLSVEAQAGFKMFAAFYTRYLSSFVNEGETEPASSLWGYLRELKWDIVMLCDKNDFRPVAAASGQVMQVSEFGSDSSKIAWRENVWSINEVRRFGLGHAAANQFNQLFNSKYGADATFGEVENPYRKLFAEVNAQNPAAFDRSPEGVEARREVWIKKFGEDIDPFDRTDFHTKNMHQLACYIGKDGKLRPVPYCQISMDPEAAQEYVTSLSFFLTPLSDRMKEDFAQGRVKVSHMAALHRTSQATITEHFREHPEFRRIQHELRDIVKAGENPGVVFVTPNSDQGYAALQQIAGRDNMQTIAGDLNDLMRRYREAERLNDSEKLTRLQDHAVIALHNVYDYQVQVQQRMPHFGAALSILADNGLGIGNRRLLAKIIHEKNSA